MNIQVLGCNHQTAPLALRERLVFGTQQTGAALQRLCRLFPHVEAVLLSTCNRVELYAATPRGGSLTRRQIVEFFSEFHHLRAEEILGNLYDWHGRDSVRHLFQVLSSLDSMVVGEAQISSQVKLAYQLAQRQEVTGPLMHAVFQSATRVARRVASETSVHERRVSIPSVAVDEFVGQIFEQLDEKRVLIVGAGAMAEETLRYLHKEGIRDIRIVNRRPQRAAELARRWNGRVADWDDRYREVARADLVVSATGADLPIIEARQLDSVLRSARRSSARNTGSGRTTRC